jgi:hypothetical protein
MLKRALFAGLALTAVPTLAQPPQSQSGPDVPQAPTPAIQAAGEAFGTCIGAGIGGLPDSATPDAGATSVLAACARQRDALVAAIESFISGGAMPAEQKQAALTQVRAQFAQAQTEIANAIRQSRAAPAEVNPSQ